MGRQPKNYDGTTPLANARRERFCLFYVGECWTNAAKAYRLAGYAPASAEKAGPRLLSFVEVWTRVCHLRKEGMRLLGIDQHEIMRLRVEIMRRGDVAPSDRLKAASDLEKNLGLSAPDRLDVTSGGQPLRCDVRIVPRGAAPDA